ncbi:MAG: endolytic transglycosylase MltG [Acidimicrobiia bacterium]
MSPDRDRSDPGPPRRRSRGPGPRDDRRTRGTVDPSDAPTEQVGIVRPPTGTTRRAGPAGVTRAERQAARRGGTRSGRSPRRDEAGREPVRDEEGPPRAIPPRRRRGRGFRVLLVLAILAAPFVIGGGWFAYQLTRSSDGPAVEFVVGDEAGASAVADALAREGVIGSALVFKAWATISGAGPFEAGTYQLNEGMGIRAAISALEEGPPPIPDTELLLPPGLTVPQIAARVGEIPGKSADAFLAAATSGSIRSKYQPPEVTSLEGLLFPDTYLIGASETEESIVRRLVARFDEIADTVGLANATALTPYETVVAASLIQTEAKVAQDAPLISAVIRNRLAQGIPLQIDSTLCYAKGGCPPVPTNADKEIDSPYNTYRIAALPPTPISSVAQASLEAALAPADVPFIYYVIADANGTHVFATTLDEHNRNVAAAQAKGLL